MKDLVSALTFGFIMAQLFPGVIATFAVTIFVKSFLLPYPNGIIDSLNQAICFWEAPTRRIVVFVLVSTAFGMAIHGLHWSVLGFLENRERRKNPLAELRSVHSSFWHDLPIIIQIILGPVKIIFEVTWFLFKGRSLSLIAIEENAPNVKSDKVEVFSFVQDFYLHFSQFYAHTSYATLLLFISLLTSILFIPTIYFGFWLSVFLVTIWLSIGYFFIVSRIQLASLFKAETSMTK